MATYSYSGSGTGGDIVELTQQEEIQRIIECPVCNSVPLPPIYNCSQGHIVCSDCSTKISKCGLCKQPITGGRNYPLETIVRGSKLSCKFKEEGCNVVLSGEGLLQHLKECDFSPVCCMYCRDKAEVPMKDFIKHLKEQHSFTGLDKEVTVNRFQECTGGEEFGTGYFSRGFMYDGKYFFCNTKRQRQTWVVWVTYVGSEVEAMQYEATITMFSSDFALPTIRWSIPIHSFRLPIIKPVDQISLQWYQLRPLMTENWVGPKGETFKYAWYHNCVVHRTSRI